MELTRPCTKMPIRQIWHLYSLEWVPYEDTFLRLGIMHSLDRRPCSPLQPSTNLVDVSHSSSTLPPWVCVGSFIRLFRSIEVFVGKWTPAGFLLVWRLWRSTLSRHSIEGIRRTDWLPFQLRFWISGSVRTLHSSSALDKCRYVLRSCRWMLRSTGVGPFDLDRLRELGGNRWGFGLGERRIWDNVS